MTFFIDTNILAVVWSGLIVTVAGVSVQINTSNFSCLWRE
uniref:Uncharacterized protein n=1 Tax=Nelumbo nucifera TaxID=4432 RepID=A0A822XM55_NELNU|nr:TPA_asm: hypothetical protein HUJ06_022575 [Nelumbo nucifera]